MDVRDALSLGRALMEEHDLAGWTLELDRAKRRAGSCQASRRRITISRELTALHDEATVRDTLLHEIAHARVGTRHGHDAVWQREARRLGCSGERTLGEDLPQAETPWVGTCPAGHTTGRHRRPTRVASCPRCSPQFSPEHLFDWTFQGVPHPVSPAYAAEVARLRHRGSGPPGSDGTVGSAASIPVGAQVRVLGGGRYAGVRGVVVKRGRTRYHVRIRGGMLTLPFALAEPVDPANQP